MFGRIIFNNDGTYKGVPLSTSGFLESIKEFDGKTNLRQRFLLHHFNTSKDNPKIAGSYSMCDYQHGDNDEDLTRDVFDEEDLSFSICSQTEYNISQSVEDIQRDLASFQSKANNEESFYDITLPAYKEALSICKTEADAHRFSDYINSFVVKEIARRGNHTMHDDGTSFFGENTSERNDNFDRWKFAHEKRSFKRNKRS